MSDDARLIALDVLTPEHLAGALKIPDDNIQSLAARALVEAGKPDLAMATLTKLGFKLDGNMAHVPSWRPDVLGEADLIVSLLAENHGRVRGVARHGRRSRRRWRRSRWPARDRPERRRGWRWRRSPGSRLHHSRWT